MAEGEIEEFWNPKRDFIKVVHCSICNGIGYTRGIEMCPTCDGTGHRILMKEKAVPKGGADSEPDLEGQGDPSD